MSGYERRAFAQREIDRALRSGTVTVRTLGPGDDPLRIIESPPHDPHADPRPDPHPTQIADPDPATPDGPNEDSPPTPSPPPLSPSPTAPRPSFPHRTNRLNLLIEQLNDRLPVTLQGRWRLDRRTGTALAAVVAVAAVVLAGWTFFRAQSRQVAEPQLVTVGQPERTRSATTSPISDAIPGPEAGPQGGPPPLSQPAALDAPTATGIVVDVEGKVAKPGVIHLPTGSRVMDALQAAGGALPGTDLVPLNQARVLNDGEQILVGTPTGLEPGGQPLGAGPAPTSAPRSGGKVPPTGPIHLNTATAEQLEQLPGVGPAMAQRILDWRAQHGSFASIGDLEQVRGLGPAKFAALRQWVTL